jgi:hypothetical protein
VGTCRWGSVHSPIFTNGLCLPSGTDLQLDQIERIAALVRSAGSAQL